MIKRLSRIFTIQRIFVKYGLEELFFNLTPYRFLRHASLLLPTRWFHAGNRTLARGERIRRALEELGPVFVKLGQALSTRRDLLPEDVGDELALLQDRVPPFDSAQARQVIEQALGDSVGTLFESFETQPLASASVAQVHGACLIDGREVIIKVLRPGIEQAISRDVSLMYLLADVATLALPDGKRLRPREVVDEYERTLEGELDLIREATNATVLRNNFEGSDKLYIPEVHWEFTRRNVMVMERIHGITIRDIPAMREIGMDMKKLAEHGVEIFYTQVFEHNFFHADMHPGNIFVSREDPAHPQYIAVDFGIIGSLTDEDQRYIGENMLAFFQRDYRRVAQLHVDSGWVPSDTRVSELESAIRAVCDPIFEKPLSEISFGNVLLQLFRTARRFEMEVQPQLVLLQKTLLNIEGLGRQLYPELDLWSTGKPFLQRWVVARNNPRHLLQRFVDQAPLLIRALPEMPMLVHELVDVNNRLARQRLREQENGKAQRKPSSVGHSIVGVGLLICSALLAGAATIAAEPTPWWVGLVAGLGGWMAWRGSR